MCVVWLCGCVLCGCYILYVPSHVHSFTPLWVLFHSAATDQLSQSSKRRFPSGYWFVLGWLMYLRVVTLHLWFSTQFRRERDQSARIVKSRRTPFLSDLRVRLRLGRTHEVLSGARLTKGGRMHHVFQQRRGRCCIATLSTRSILESLHSKRATQVHLWSPAQT